MVDKLGWLSSESSAGTVGQWSPHMATLGFSQDGEKRDIPKDRLQCVAFISPFFASQLLMSHWLKLVT